MRPASTRRINRGSGPGTHRRPRGPRALGASACGSPARASPAVGAWAAGAGWSSAAPPACTPSHDSWTAPPTRLVLERALSWRPWRRASSAVRPSSSAAPAPGTRRCRPAGRWQQLLGSGELPPGRRGVRGTVRPGLRALHPPVHARALTEPLTRGRCRTAAPASRLSGRRSPRPAWGVRSAQAPRGSLRRLLRGGRRRPRGPSRRGGPA